MADMNQILYTAQPTVEGSCVGQPTSLYVGDSSSAVANNLTPLENAQVHGILNVALDNYDPGFQTNGYLLNFSKVGLCDTGPRPGSSKKNDPATMIKAVQAVDQLLAAAASEDSPQVLVHCWSGGSRSVTIAALWIAQRLQYEPASGQTRFMTAINMVRKCRQLGFGNPYDSSHPYTPYDPSDADASGTPGNPYPDGKPMAAVFDMAQSIDESQEIPVGTGPAPSWDEPGTCPESTS
jgi:hypothetical protein